MAIDVTKFAERETSNALSQQPISTPQNSAIPEKVARNEKFISKEELKNQISGLRGQGVTPKQVAQKYLEDGYEIEGYNDFLRTKGEKPPVDMDNGGMQSQRLSALGRIQEVAEKTKDGFSLADIVNPIAFANDLMGDVKLSDKLSFNPFYEHKKDDGFFKSAGKSIANLLPSVGNVAVGLGDLVLNTDDVIEALGGSLYGLTQKAYGKLSGNSVNTEYTELTDNMREVLSANYKDIASFKRALVEDPAAILTDALSVVSLGAGTVAKGASISGKVSKVAGATRIATKAQRIASTATKIANWADRADIGGRIATQATSALVKKQRSGIKWAVGKAGGSKVGRGLEAAGEWLYNTAVTPTKQEAELMQGFEIGRLSKKPVTRTSVGLEEGVTGLTRKSFGDNSKKEAMKLWNDKVSPYLKKGGENGDLYVDQGQFLSWIDEVKATAENIVDDNRRNATMQEIDGFEKKYSDFRPKVGEEIDTWRKQMNQDAKKSFNESPEVIFGKNMIAMEMGKKIRSTVHDYLTSALGEDSKNLYMKYHYLDELGDMGINARTTSSLGAKAGGSGTFIENFLSMALTPIATYGGVALYRGGKGIESFFGPAGMSKVSDVVGDKAAYKFTPEQMQRSAAEFTRQDKVETKLLRQIEKLKKANESLQKRVVPQEELVESAKKVKKAEAVTAKAKSATERAKRARESLKKEKAKIKDKVDKLKERGVNEFLKGLDEKTYGDVFDNMSPEELSDAYEKMKAAVNKEISKEDYMKKMSSIQKKVEVFENREKNIGTVAGKKIGKSATKKQSKKFSEDKERFLVEIMQDLNVDQFEAKDIYDQFA